ncbi:MAG: heparan-alpha-glucosaminide N-acetyltransferase domain-containing protein [Verrucomicrobiota bacterium]|nr:heparan-alpha-glucosaminide N-acetyltransferase domain-containing protein [Verrucomicrobiota bacterium]
MAPRPRVESVDVLRGLVMVIMALDHTRDYFSSYDGSPTDAATAPGMIFFTRWVTHLCAPTFVFLAGTSIYLQFLRKSRPQLARFLVSRGVWLMVLELLVVSSLLTFHPSVHFVFLQVIWVTGISMILMAALIYLPVPLVGAFGAIPVLAHNAFDWVRPERFGPVAGTIWRLLHVPGFLVAPASGNFWMALYPLIPWPGIMALGFAFGVFLQRAPAQRQRVTLLLGGASLFLFSLLRSTNLYGDPLPWRHQVSAERTFMSFMDVQKYPPSLLYVLVTLGVSLLLLAAFDRWHSRDIFLPVRSILSVYGRVPFFYYVLHFTSIHLAALLTTAALGLDWRWWVSMPPSAFVAGKPPGYGFSLPIVYLVWLLIVIFCYFPCRWFAGVKQRNRSVWLSYL